MNLNIKRAGAEDIEVLLYRGFDSVGLQRIRVLHDLFVVPAVA